jgi:ligand-binding sensor domain-containing protein
LADSLRVYPRIYRTSVGGGQDTSKWEMVYQFQTKGYGHVAPKFNDPNVFWVSETDKLYKVNLNTSTVVKDTVGLPDMSYSSIKDMVYVNNSKNDALFVAMKHGLYYKDNTMSGFKYICGLPNVPVYDLEIDYCTGRLIVATHGRGIWKPI